MITIVPLYEHIDREAEQLSDPACRAGIRRTIFSIAKQFA
jgi:hypothetical protein